LALLGVLGVVPYLLVGIEIRSIRRQPFYVQPVGVCLAESAHSGPMRPQPIHHHQQAVAQPAVNQTKKGDHVMAADVVIVS